MCNVGCLSSNKRTVLGEIKGFCKGTRRRMMKDYLAIWLDRVNITRMCHQ